MWKLSPRSTQCTPLHPSVSSFRCQKIAKVRKSLTKFGWIFECWAVQKRANLVDLAKSFPTRIYLQNSASIQPWTSPVKDPHSVYTQIRIWDSEIPIRKMTCRYIPYWYIGITDRPKLRLSGCSRLPWSWNDSAPSTPRASRRGSTWYCAKRCTTSPSMRSTWFTSPRCAGGRARWKLNENSLKLRA